MDEKRQLQNVSELILAVASGTTISVADARGRDKITLRIPDLYGLRQLPSPAIVTLVGGAPNTTYYLYATKPDLPWGQQNVNAADSFKFVLEPDGTLTFEHLLLGTALTDGAGNIVEISSDLPQYTVADMHVYVNSVTGDDANSGLAADEAKATIQAAYDLIPFHLLHNVAVHMEGTFTGGATIERVVNAGKMLLLDGGPGLTVVADDGGSPWVADISSASSIGLSTLAWTANQYEGYIVEILTGPAAGQNRLIHSHTTDTITPVRFFAIDPGPGAEFRIVRPTTTLAGPSEFVTSQVGGYFGGGGIIKLQRMYFDATSALNCSGGNGGVTLSHLILDNYSAALPLVVIGTAFRGNTAVRFEGALTDPDTFFTALGGIGFATESYAGIKGGTVALGIDFDAGLSGSVIKVLLNIATLKLDIQAGCRINFLACIRAINESYGGFPLNPPFFGPGFNCISWFNYAYTTFGPGLPAFGTGGQPPPLISLDNSSLTMGFCDVIGGLHNGIEVMNGYLYLNECISSVPNANAGVYAHSGSIVQLRGPGKAATPAITGTAVGDFTVDDTVLASTWAAIHGGTPFADTNEMVVAKVYERLWAEYTFP